MIQKIISVSLCFIFLILVSCQPPVKVEIRPQPIPSLDTKVYPAPGIDWPSRSRFTLDFQEVGKPETARNQILENYLLRQAVDNLARKGYSYDSTSSNFDVRIRIYFDVKEEHEKTNLVYDFSPNAISRVFTTQYNLASGIWQTASLAATTWITRGQETLYYYKGNITIEIFDREGKNQLWRGDVSAPLASDDIRIASNWMIRDVLWGLPALDYPAVSVPSVTKDEFDKFWNAFIENREFYSPGQPYPMAIKSNLRTSNQSDALAPESQLTEKELLEAKQQFKQTEGYRIALSYKSTFEDLESTDEYKKEFRKFFGDNLPRLKKENVEKYSRFAVAITDLLQTAPWSIKLADKTLVITGRYFVGTDENPTNISIIAEPLTAKRLHTLAADYEYKKYFITKIDTISSSEYNNFWTRGNAYRESIFGQKIDFVPNEPTAAIKK